MKRLSPLVVVLAFPLVTSCVRTLEEEPERLASFDVKVDFDAQPTPGDPTATCPGPGGVVDLCPGAAGTFEAPVAFPGDVWAQLRVDVMAVGTKGTRPYPFNGQVNMTVRAGEVFGPTRRAVLTDGVVEDHMIRIRRTPGTTVVWAEDALENEETLPTFTAGVSDIAIEFDQPTIKDVQYTTDEATSPLFGQRIDVTRGDLYVTRIAGSGFNVADVSTPEWGGMFIFAFNGIEGLRVGSKLLGLGGAVTEFQSSTQMTEPIYTPVNGLCGAPRGNPEGGEVTEEDESGAGRARCPRGSECKRDDEGVERCIPDTDATLDGVGRKICTGGAANECPTGTSCQLIADQGSFCQVVPQILPGDAFPTAPYCGPINTQNILGDDGDLLIERYEGSLVKIVGTGTLGVRPSGLPICKEPVDDDPLTAVRSTCYLVRPNGNPVTKTDCTMASPGDPVLRNDLDAVCWRGNQACRLDGNQTSEDVRSTCNDEPTLSRCQLAEPGDPVLTDCNPEEESCDLAENDELRICRNTLDDFLMSGFISFGQAKVFFEDAEGTSRCATVNFDALSGFDYVQALENGTRWRSITGTLRQVRFRSATSYWVVDVRFAEDLEAL
jgi:hypothetical protein